jgi:hypothetical protein
MQYDIHEATPHAYMIVPEQGAPLPIIFRDRAEAQRMAHWLTTDRRVAGAPRPGRTPAAPTG